MMNFFKRKFSFHEDDPIESFEDPTAPSGPPSSFSFQAIANKVSNTISAPTSPARSNESLAAALERSLQQDRSRGGPAMHPDAKVLLVIDNQIVDWSKYFRNQNEYPIRVEQADFTELDVMSTEHSCNIEINQIGKDSRSFSPQAVFIGPGASRRCHQSKNILRALIAAGIPFVNSHTSMIAFMDKNNLKKQLRKISLPDSSRLPMLPTIHYPSFHKFHPSTSFPCVVSVNEGQSGIGKIKINSHEELCDIEGMLQMMRRNDTEVEIEPYVDIKYDLHVQKIGNEYKTFMRRGISRGWKSNVGAAVLEQIQTNERHKQYIKSILDHVGSMAICSIDILVSKEGREFVHDVKDVIAFYGESQEDDRRATSILLRALVLHQNRLRSRTSIESPREPHPPTGVPHQHAPPPQPPQTFTNGHSSHPISPPHHPPIPPPRPIPRGQSSEREQWDMKDKEASQQQQQQQQQQTSFADDTMGQLKRTFAGIFGDV